MTYVGKKPADIIATAVDTTTGTFSGDLTVDTNTLYVDSANNRVGVGTSSPNNLLTLENGDFQIHETGSSDPLITLSVGNTQASPTQSWGFRIDNSDSDKFQIRDFTGANTVITADTSGNVGINTTSSVRDLQIGDNTRSASILSLQTNSSGNGSIYFGDNTTTNAEYGGMIRYSHSDNAMLFWTSSTERMRIDSSGNLLVGVTSTTIPGVGNTTEGVSLRGSTGSASSIFASRATASAGYFNINADGDILSLRQSGTQIGSLGTNGTRLHIASTGNSGLRFRDDLSAILPCNADGSNSDGDQNLGVATVRFKDLYLSGGVYLGGTGSANKLDDYEEGTWTPVLKDSDPTTGTIVGTSSNNSKYVKIGNLVHATLYIQRNDASSLTSQIFVTNLPFISDNYPATNGTAWFNNLSSDWRTLTYTGSDATWLYFPLAGNSNDSITTNQWDNGRYIYASFTYRTT